MKYLSMICRGHVPEYRGYLSGDTRSFVLHFLPKEGKRDKAAVLAAVRHLHLAFKTMETEEIYDVLMEQFLKAAAKFDPRYTEKLKQVVEVIENALSGSPFFRAVDVDRHLEFGGDRYLRLLCRRGFLVAKRQEGEKRTAYGRSETWPPPSEFFTEPIGITDGPSKGLPILPLGRDWNREPEQTTQIADCSTVDTAVVP